MTAETQSELAPVQLRKFFVQATESGTLGGSAVLAELAKRASACFSVSGNERRAVAFALSSLANQHAEDRDERVVTGDENVAFLTRAHQPVSNAITFIEDGGTADMAVQIIAALIELIPTHRRPSGSN